MPDVRTLSVRKGRDWARAATHCVHGHPYDESNTLWTNGKRRCRACNREWLREWRRYG